MERENSKFKEASEEIDSLVRTVNNLSAILPILIIFVKIAVLYFANLREGIGDNIELIITSFFGGFIVRAFFDLNKFHDQYSKRSCETLVIPEQIRNSYDDSIVKEVEKKPDYIGSVKLLLEHGFKDLIGQIFSTIIAVAGLWVPDSLTKNSDRLALIFSYFVLTVIIFCIVSCLLNKITSRPIQAQDFAGVGFCIFTSIISIGALFFFEFVFFLDDARWWEAFIIFYVIFIVVVIVGSCKSKRRIPIVEKLYYQIKNDNNS